MDIPEELATEQTTKAEGLNLLSHGTGDGRLPEVDIVAIPGLDSDPWHTWVWKPKSVHLDSGKKFSIRPVLRNLKSRNKMRDGETCPQPVMWLKDILPQYLKNARIATYSYKSGWKRAGLKTDLYAIARQLLVELTNWRKDAVRHRPLILLGYSFGGLVIQKALTTAVHFQPYADIVVATSGVVFLGCPFGGSSLADSRLAKWWSTVAGGDSAILDMLKSQSQELNDLSDDFLGSFGDRHITCFYEGRPSEYVRGVFEPLVVSRVSATLLRGQPIIYLDADHSGLNTFSGPKDHNFELVFEALREITTKGRAAVASRIEKQGATRSKKICWGIPREPTGLLTGRSDVIDEIKHALLSDNTTQQKRHVITGLGGIGKSEVCLQLIKEIEGQFEAIAWVDVSDTSSATKGFIGLAAEFGRQVSTIDDAKHALSGGEQKRLLILDNADDPDFDYQRYFICGSNWTIVITSRVPGCNIHNTAGFKELTALDPEHSIDLLLKAAGQPRNPSNEAAAKLVLECLQSHTLAIVQAGALVAAGYCTLTEYPELLKTERKQVLQFSRTQEEPRYRDVYATFEASAAFLNASDKLEAQDALVLLGVLSMFHYSPFPLVIFQKAWEGAREILKSELDEDKLGINYTSKTHVNSVSKFLPVSSAIWTQFRLHNAVHRLTSLSLAMQATREDGINTISMHPLVHAWARDRQGTHQHEAWTRAGSVITLSWFSDNETLRPFELLLRPHLHSFIKHGFQIFIAEAPNAAILQTQLRCAWLLQDMRDDQDLKSYLDWVFGGLQEDARNPTLRLLPLYKVKARNLSHLGDTIAAISLWSRIEDIEKTILESDDPDRLTSQHELAYAYQANGENDEAIALLQHVVEVREKTLAETHPHRLASQHALARAYQANGQIDEAIALLQHVVEVREKTLAETHPHRLVSQHELARAYQANGQIDKAIALMEHVVKIKEKTLAETHRERLVSLDALAYYCRFRFS